MLFKELRNLDKKIRDLDFPGEILTNTAAHVRSCGCSLLTLHFEGLILDTWNKHNEKILNLIEDSDFNWNIVYLNSFPGTDIINKVTFRHFCDHCLENYKLDGVVGMGSMVFRERMDDW